MKYFVVRLYKFNDDVIYLNKQEKKTGTIRNTKHEITDLPGIYSLSPYSVEEDVSRKFIFDENIDVIISFIFT